MSVATPFKFRQPFPFCPSDISGSVPASALHIDNLTLSAVMAFFWNFESFTLTIVGTSSRTIPPDSNTLNAGLTVTLSPAASSFFDHINNLNGCPWLGAAYGDTVLASAPPIRQPIARVCHDGSWATGRLVDFEFSYLAGGPETGGFTMNIWLGTDPSNTGRYRIYYSYTMNRFSEGPPAVEMYWSNISTARVGFSALTSGTFALAGLTFNYYSFYDGSSATGGTLTATSSNYTYP